MCISREKYEKVAKKLSRKLTEYKKESRKEFDKWRKENRVVCSEIEKNASQPSEQAPAPSSLKEEKDVVYNQKYEFPINEVCLLVHDLIRKSRLSTRSFEIKSERRCPS